jgi:hypothetical protein
MRPVIFTSILFLLIGSAANAQLTIQPQLGFENTKTTVSYNDLNRIVPLSGQLTPQLAVRVDYKFKQQHGPFLGVSTSRSLVSYEFSDPDNGMKIYKASAGDIQLRLEGGYQFSSKPFYFSKPKAMAQPAPAAAPMRHQYRSYGSAYSQGGRCGRSNDMSSQKYKSQSSSAVQSVKEKEKGWYMAVQPLLGAALMPAVKSDIIRQASGSQSSYVYNAGNWRSALITGAGFEFGKNTDKKFIVTVSYLKALGNLDNSQLTTMSGAKENVTQLKSDVSAWSIKAGIPITLSKKKTVVKQVVTEQPREQKKQCGGYNSRCKRVI